MGEYETKGEAMQDSPKVEAAETPMQTASEMGGSGVVPAGSGGQRDTDPGRKATADKLMRG